MKNVKPASEPASTLKAVVLYVQVVTLARTRSRSPFVRFLSTVCRTRQRTGRWKQSQGSRDFTKGSALLGVKLAFVPLQATALAIFRKSGFVVVEDSMLVGLS